MKSVTEFANVTLKQALAKKASLSAEGKSAEEIQQGLGEAFKMEGDKLKYFLSALDVAGQNSENLKRVIVMSLNEGENAPQKATKIEEHYYVPEFHVDPKRASAPKDDQGGRGGKGRGGRDGGRGKGGGQKESPWGLSPEQKAAKKGGGAGKPAPK